MPTRERSNPVETEQTACILCSRNCGLKIEAEGGRWKRITGDESHPVSKGYLCQKAARLTHYQNNDDLLTHPLKRTSTGEFVRVSWDEAIADIAARLLQIRRAHGGKAFAFYGGGGQGNHLGGAYGRQLLKAMRSRFAYNALGQEKTGDFWVNGRLFGDQRCHVTEDVEHADFVLFIGTNPFQAHGIPNARDTLRDLKKSVERTMVVVDPRKTETARASSLHLQLRPGTDAFLIAAMLGIIVREGLHDRAFLAQRCTGFEALEAELLRVPVEDFVRRADVPLADVERTARGFATAKRACVRVDLGIQQSLHSTLNSYLEKLLFLVTGHFGGVGQNNLHGYLLPILGNTDERRTKPDGTPRYPRTAHHRMHPIAGIYPPNILPSEIEHHGEDRVRALFVDSANPVMTGANMGAYERAFAKLELLVVVDVALTETARLAHYVLPAATQFEKWECTGFNLEFPDNAFHLRHPILPPRAEALPEPEIYTRLLEAMGEVPTSLGPLRSIATHEPKATHHLAFFGALGALLTASPKLKPYAASILYRTVGAALKTPRQKPNHAPAAAAAPLLALSILLAQRDTQAVKRAGFTGSRATLGQALFGAILDSAQGVVMTRHTHDEMWAFLRHRDRKIHLAIPEMLAALRALADEPKADHPLVLLAGERRAYNANQIYRDPAWRKTDPDGAMRVHPEDARELGLRDGGRATCTSDTGALTVTIELDDSVRRGMVTLPHGYGMRFRGGPPIGPELNRLTASDHCDPLARTPFHKHVPVRLSAIE